MEYTEKEVFDCISETSKLIAEQNAAQMSNVLAAAKQADVLSNNVEFWNWLGKNYRCLGSSENIQAAAMNNPQWLKRTVLQGKGYEWDFMTAQRNSFEKLFSRFDAGNSATQVGIDITETNVVSGNINATYQNKAYTSTNTPNLKNTPKDAIVVTNKEQVANVQNQGYDTIEFQDSKTIQSQTEKRMEQARSGNATGQYTLKNVGSTMAKAGLVGAAIGIGTETLFSFKRLKSGEITPKQYLLEIGKSGLQGGITGAAASGIMIPVQAAITAAGASTIVGIPIAIAVSVALDKIIAPAFGRGDYAKYLSQAKFYKSITDMSVPLIEELDMSSKQFENFMQEIASQHEHFVEVTDINQQLNQLQTNGNKMLADKGKINKLNTLINGI